MKLNKNSGFTLLEIIIVIIIVGVLASLALPRFFSTVEFSRSTEALNAIGVVRKSVERCGMIADDVTGCGDTDFGEIDIDDPGLSSGAHFTYTIAITGSNTYQVIAQRNTVDGGTEGDSIILTIDPSAGSPLARSGSGAFSAIK